MSSPDYDIHLDRNKFDSLFDSDEGEMFPFGEDIDDIDRVIEEELGTPRKRKRKPRR